MKILQIILVLLCTAQFVNATIMEEPTTCTDGACVEKCTWVDTSTTSKVWVADVDTGYTYKEAKSSSQGKKGGVNNSYRCYRGQQSDYAKYENNKGFQGYTVEFTTDASGLRSENPYLFLNGVQVDECDYTYKAASKSHSNKPSTWADTTSNGYWAIITNNSGHMVCVDCKSEPQTNTPVPEPATMLLVGAGLIGLAGVYRRRK